MEKYINMSIALNDDGCFWEESQIGVGTTMIDPYKRRAGGIQGWGPRTPEPTFLPALPAQPVSWPLRSPSVQPSRPPSNPSHGEGLPVPLESSRSALVPWPSAAGLPGVSR